MKNAVEAKMVIQQQKPFWTRIALEQATIMQDKHVSHSRYLFGSCTLNATLRGMLLMVLFTLLTIVSSSTYFKSSDSISSN